MHNTIAGLDIDIDNLRPPLVVVTTPILVSRSVLADGACILTIGHFDLFGTDQIFEFDFGIRNDMPQQHFFDVGIGIGGERGGIVKGGIGRGKDGPQSVAQVVHEGVVLQKGTEYGKCNVRASNFDCSRNIY